MKIEKTILLLIISCIAMMPLSGQSYTQGNVVNILEAVSIPQVPFRKALNLSVCSIMTAGQIGDKIILMRSLNYLNKSTNSALINKLLQDSSTAVKIETIKYLYRQVSRGSRIHPEVRAILTGLYTHNNALLNHYINALCALAVDSSDLPFGMESDQAGRINYIEIMALKGIDIDTMQMTENEIKLYSTIRSQGSNSE